MQEGKGKFSLKITLDPFTEKDVKVVVDHGAGAVRVTGSRRESTGVIIDYYHYYNYFCIKKVLYI